MESLFKLFFEKNSLKHSLKNYGPQKKYFKMIYVPVNTYIYVYISTYIASSTLEIKEYCNSSKLSSKDINIIKLQL